MKIKIVGFKVGKSRPTENRTLDFGALKGAPEGTENMAIAGLGLVLVKILAKSDFISIRRVDE